MYKIKFSITHQFAIVGKTVGFYILDSFDSKVIELSDTLHSEIGTISEVTSGTYSILIENIKVGKDAPPSLMEEVIITSDLGDLEYLNKLTLCYLPEIVPIELYLGQILNQYWNPGIIDVVVDSEDIVTCNGSSIIGIMEGSTECDLNFKVDDLVETISYQVIVLKPEVDPPEVSNLKAESVTLSTNSFPNEDVIIKFRYGLLEDFDPIEDTTYIETKASEFSLNIEGLCSDTWYACQSVLVLYDKYYVNDEYIKFKTKSGTNRIYFDIPDSGANLITAFDQLLSVSANIEKVDLESIVRWSTQISLPYELEVADDSINIHLGWDKPIYYITKDHYTSSLIVTASEIIDDKIIATHSGKLCINIYQVVNTVRLCLLGNKYYSKSITLNKELNYLEYYPDENCNITYDLDYKVEDGKIISTSISPLQISRNTVETILKLNKYNYTFNLNINIMAQINFPPAEGILAENVKVFNSSSEMFHSYPGVEYAVMEDNDVNYYLFKTGTVESTGSGSSTTEEWIYDICVLAPEVIAKGVSTDNSDSGSGN